MPAESKKQRRATAIAEHDPGALYDKNKGLAEMSKESLHDFAATKEKGLPEKAHTGRGYGKDMRSGHGRHARPRGK